MTLDGGRPANRLLSLMPADVRSRLAPKLASVALSPRERLHAAGDPLPYVYFPESGVVCLMSPERAGETEMTAIGCEGMVGIEAALGGTTASANALVQLSGEAVRVPAAALRAAMEDCPALQELVLRYLRYFLGQALQTAACNALHSVEQRCAKWLLNAHDRGGAGTFRLTQEFLAEVLGVHRPSVSIIAGSLQKARLIRYTRGVITLLDRRGLEQTACACHGILRHSLDELLPLPRTRSTG